MNSLQDQDFSGKIVNLLQIKANGNDQKLSMKPEPMDRATREGMLEELYKSCPEILEKLSLKDRESERVKDTLILLGDAIFPCILPLLSDSREQVRINAVEIMGLLGSARALNAVMSMPKDVSADVESKRAWVKDLYLWRNP
jgi:hypothetical protein